MSPKTLVDTAEALKGYERGIGLDEACGGSAGKKSEYKAVRYACDRCKTEWIDEFDPDDRERPVEVKQMMLCPECMNPMFHQLVLNIRRRELTEEGMVDAVTKAYEKGYQRGRKEALEDKGISFGG